MTPEALERACSTILPSLTEAFSSTSADVRKAVVDALVAMYDSLGDWLLPKLTSLTAAQQKLLTIYINRAAERREKGGLGKVGGVLMPGRVPLAPRPPQ
jgi:CLIP-associating protein 1/2